VTEHYHSITPQNDKYMYLLYSTSGRQEEVLLVPYMAQSSSTKL